MPNTKALDLPVSEKKNFEVGLLWSYVPTCDPKGHHMKKLGRGLQGDATYKILKL